VTRLGARSLVATTAVAIGVLAVTPGCGSGGSSGTSPENIAFYGGTIQVTASGGSTLPLTKIDDIKQVAGVKTAFPTYRFDATTGEVKTAGVAESDSIVASDPTEAAWSGLKTAYAQGHAIDADSSGEVVLGSTIARTLGKTIGDTVNLPLHPAGGAVSHPFKVVGILDVTRTGPDRFAYVNITDGQLLLKDALPAGPVDVTAVATAIDVFAKAGTSIADLDKIADQINQQVAGVKAIKPSELIAGIKPG
jgi:ABC-type lipoprotein release transport system permease subunit